MTRKDFQLLAEFTGDVLSSCPTYEIAKVVYRSANTFAAITGENFASDRFKDAVCKQARTHTNKLDTEKLFNLVAGM